MIRETNCNTQNGTCNIFAQILRQFWPVFVTFRESIIAFIRRLVERSACVGTDCVCVCVHYCCVYITLCLIYHC